MAMTPKPWSISALATEFGLDRRTVALRIRGAKPAGTERGNRVWRLEDVAPLLSDKRKQVQSDEFDPVVAAVEDRLAHWREIHAEPPVVWTFDDYCENTGTSPAAALVQLRAGMPFATVGDFETGAGFTIRSAASFDWQLLMIRAMHGAGRRDLLRKLGI